jgi:hypothetical protein
MHNGRSVLSDAGQDVGADSTPAAGAGADDVSTLFADEGDQPIRAPDAAFDHRTALFPDEDDAATWRGATLGVATLPANRQAAALRWRRLLLLGLVVAALAFGTVRACQVTKTFPTSFAD